MSIKIEHVIYVSVTVFSFDLRYTAIAFSAIFQHKKLSAKLTAVYLFNSCIIYNKSLLMIMQLTFFELVRTYNLQI